MADGSRSWTLKDVALELQRRGGIADLDELRRACREGEMVAHKVRGAWHLDESAAQEYITAHSPAQEPIAPLRAMPTLPSSPIQSEDLEELDFSGWVVEAEESILEVEDAETPKLEVVAVEEPSVDELFKRIAGVAAGRVIGSSADVDLTTEPSPFDHNAINPSSPFQSFHPSGSLAAEGQLQEGQASGVWRFFHESGALAREGRYVDGEPVGEWQIFDLDGKALGRS